MAEEHKLLRDTDRALKARDLLENEFFNEALVNIKAELMLAWETTPARDTDGRERCWTAVQQLGRLKGYFETMIRDGKLAQVQLDALAEKENA